VAGMPECLVQLRLAGRRVAGRQLAQSGQVAEGGGVPKPVDARTATDEQPRDVPAAVADGIVKGWSTGDRCAGRFELRPAFDQGLGDVDVIGTRSPVQRGLG